MAETLTIVVPVFNEEECLPIFFQAIDNFIKIVPMNTKILFVNDGSTDTSLKILQDACKARKSYCSVLSFDMNYGLSTALKAGFDHCSSSLIGYIDADLQTHPEDFLQFIKFFPEFDMVNGTRQDRKDHLVKKFSSKIANAYRRLMINDQILDTCCPLKMAKSRYVQQMPFFKGMHRFMPALIQLQGGKVKQVPISHYPRLAGSSKYYLWNRLIGPFFDTLAFRWIRKRTIRYQIIYNSDE